MIYLSCVLLGALGAWAIAGHGWLLGLVDRPTPRSSHTVSTPKGGGIGVLAAFVLACLATDGLEGLLAAGLLIALASLVNDRFDLPAKLRLLIQFTAAIGFMAWTSMRLPDGALLGALLVPLFCVFIVGTANFYNFMDGINGIAGITGVVGFSLMAWFAVSSGAEPALATPPLCLALGCLGFLPFNAPRARVFLGDVGSVLLGFAYACLVLMLARNLAEFLCLVSFLFPFYADELSTMRLRLRDGENLLQPHRRHFYQILANQGAIAHWRVSSAYGAVQLLIGVCTLFLLPWGAWALLAFLLTAFVAFAAVRARIAAQLEPERPAREEIRKEACRLGGN